jgi:uncharacterized protein YybS (DUF2232 family)
LLNIGWKSLAWSAAAVIMLISLATPLNFLTTFLIMAPFVILYTMLKPKVFIAHLVPIGIVAYFLSGSYGPVILTLAFFFLVPSLAMGHMYKKGSTARNAILLGFIILLVQLLLELVLFSVQFNIDLASELNAVLTDSLKQLDSSNLLPSGWAVDTAKSLGDAIMTALPMLLLASAFLFTIITHGISRWGLRMVGLQAPALPEARTWRVPKSIVFYYLIGLVASLIIPSDSGGYWTVVVANLVPILRLVFTVQAIGFFFFLAHAKSWNKVVPVLLSVPVLLFPPFYLIGLLDAAFPLRRYFVK